MTKRTSTAIWKGNGMQGQGTLSTPSGVFREQPFSFRTRFQNEDGRAGTNPEELIGAAHAGCFAMALSFALAEKGFTAEELKVAATVKLDKQGNGFAITGIDLVLEARVPGLPPAPLREVAEGAKRDCPVSKALSATPISLTIP